MRFLYLMLAEPRPDFAEACLALTPKVFCVGVHLYLEITATEKYFGGFEGWMARFEALRALYENEIPFEGVVVDKPEWGAALSPGARRLLILPEGQSQAALFAKGLTALLTCGDPQKLEEEKPLREKLILFMKRVGLNTVGDFARLPNDAVVRRFGKGILPLHDMVLGQRPLCLRIFEPDHRLVESLDAEEASSQESLIYLMNSTLNKMEARLLGRAALAKKITFTFRLESGTKRKDLFLTEPSRNSAALLKLFSEWVNGLKWDSPLRKVGVEVTDAIAQGSRQLHLFDDDETRQQDLQTYLERLRHRLGQDKAGFIKLKESHLPECTWEMVSQPVLPLKKRDFYPARPLYLFSPRPFVFNAAVWRLTPTEKLTTSWWSGEPPRQYYLAHGPNDEKLWLFQTQDQWYLHGEFC